VSGLPEAVDEYVAIRRALGFKLVGIDRLLHDFVRFLEERGEPRITIKAVVAWAVMPGKSDSLHYSRLAAVRLFASYLQGANPTVEIPGVDLLPLGAQRRRPFLFSDEELAALLNATETLKQPRRPACAPPSSPTSGSPTSHSAPARTYARSGRAVASG
jgi:hypothetical protein